MVIAMKRLKTLENKNKMKLLRKKFIVASEPIYIVVTFQEEETKCYCVSSDLDSFSTWGI